MAWGAGGMAGGGGGFMQGSAGRPGGGLPFAGIPSELQSGVERLIADEPDHGEPDADPGGRGAIRPVYPGYARYVRPGSRVAHLTSRPPRPDLPVPAPTVADC